MDGKEKRSVKGHLVKSVAAAGPVSIEVHRASVLQRRDEAERLGEDIAELASRIQAATYELLVLIRAFDEREGWSGCKSCAHWLNWRTGLALGAAREKVRVARALGTLPLLSEAMQRGQVSYSKVRALTRVATPANERRLLDFALCAPASHVERLARAWRRADQQAEAVDEQRRHEAEPSAPRGAAAGDGASYVSAETSTDEAPKDLLRTGAPDVSAETSPSVAPKIAEGDAPRVAMASASPGTAGQAALEDTDGLRVSPEAARRMACDAGAVVMRHATDGALLDVGRKTRTIPPALRRALQARDRQSRFPGCNARRCDAHDVRHWADGGPTRLDNLILLCRRHHRAIHEEGFTVRLDPAGHAVFVWPDGRPFPDVPPAPRWTGRPLAPTDGRLAAADIEIGPETATPGWYGDRLDLAYAMDVMWMPRTDSGTAAAGART